MNKATTEAFAQVVRESRLEDKYQQLIAELKDIVFVLEYLKEKGN